MSNAAFAFMQTSHRPHVNDDVRARLLALACEMDAIYKKHMRQSTGRTCDICGKGDNSAKHRVKDVVHGYTHREEQSPCLCYNHACGWAHSFNSMNIHKQSDREVDLHFAQYVATQLRKAATKEKANG